MKSNEEKISDANERPLPRWTGPNFLDEFDEAPCTGGVYEIGFRLPGRHSYQKDAPPWISGYNYPSGFMPMYVGKHKISIRERLRHHCEESYHKNNDIKSKVNKCISTYYNMEKFIRELGVCEVEKALTKLNGGVLRDYTYLFSELYFTYIPLQEPDKFEALRLGLFRYPWNEVDQPKNRELLLSEGSLDLKVLYEAKTAEEDMLQCKGCRDIVSGKKMMLDPSDVHDDFNLLIADLSKVQRDENSRRVKANAERKEFKERLFQDPIDDRKKKSSVNIGGGEKVSASVFSRKLEDKLKREKIYREMAERRNKIKTK
ncbi:hypothetical protein ACJJIK_19245 [Microbulbifer sp. ZKSA006]|uniref:hypothetical protein n=1 Tax=Microbulbifer sp. ZKSA006 TaxID=3243390 RepID=UPI00403984CB